MFLLQLLRFCCTCLTEVWMFPLWCFCQVIKIVYLWFKVTRWGCSFSFMMDEYVIQCIRGLWDDWKLWSMDLFARSVLDLICFKSPQDGGVAQISETFKQLHTDWVVETLSVMQLRVFLCLLWIITFLTLELLTQAHIVLESSWIQLQFVSKVNTWVFI